MSDDNAPGSRRDHADHHPIRDCRRCNDGLLESSDGWMRCGCKDLDLGWVIVGGESGPGAPAHESTAEEVLSQKGVVR